MFRKGSELELVFRTVFRDFFWQTCVSPSLTPTRDVKNAAFLIQLKKCQAFLKSNSIVHIQQIKFFLVICWKVSTFQRLVVVVSVDLCFRPSQPRQTSGHPLSNQFLVSSSTTARPCTPLGARCLGHNRAMRSTPFSSARHSMVADEVRPPCVHVEVERHQYEEAGTAWAVLVLEWDIPSGFVLT